MLLGMGWAIVQASQRALAAELSSDEIDKLDIALQAEDARLRAEARKWLEQNGESWLKWQFCEQLNNHGGLLQFMTSRNHRSSSLWELLAFLANQSKGTHGVAFVHDDESVDYPRSYRIWRIFEGSVSEHDDPFFSPMIAPDPFGGDLTIYR